ncbi:MAG: Hsp70 family protein [Nitrospiraceae bacterium]|nr:Hsp70 family protein [Nitrospiraceae bacterium]
MSGVLIVDTSVLIAIAKREPETVDFLTAFGAFPGDLIIPASVYLEAVSVLYGSRIPRGWLDLFVKNNAFTFAPITEGTARLAELVHVHPSTLTGVLKRLVEGASRQLGEEVRDAVITVPAYFTEAQREGKRPLPVAEVLKDGRVKNPALVLEPEARRVSHVFEAEPNWIFTDVDGEEIDEQEEAEGGEEGVEAKPEEDPYFARAPPGAVSNACPTSPTTCGRTLTPAEVSAEILAVHRPPDTRAKLDSRQVKRMRSPECLVGEA